MTTLTLTGTCYDPAPFCTKEAYDQALYLSVFLEDVEFSYSISRVDGGWMLWWSDCVANDWHEWLPTEFMAIQRFNHLRDAVGNDTPFRPLVEWMAAMSPC